MRVGFALALFLYVALPSGASGQEAASAAPDFSETRLREGKEAYGARRTVEAIDQLRVAVFGFLDRPALLCESLVYLALADEAAEHHTEARLVVERLLEAERRFPECSEAKIDKTARAEFATRFHVLLPGGTPSVPQGSPTPTSKAPAPTPRPPS